MPRAERALRVPVSTYRLQFNRLLTFREAASVISYLSELGITDIYASPYLKARPGSLHGYDILDYEELNPEIGTREDYALMLRALREHGMGQVLDIVPNHMCIVGENRWWLDVLENGKSSPYASYFDIDWDPPTPTLKDKVLLPILGEQFGQVLESGQIKLELAGGALYIVYYDHRLPVDPSTYEIVLRPGLEEFEKAGPPKEQFEELMSILTALAHLPPSTSSEQEKIAERQREKEIIKKRLNALYEASAEVRGFIDRNIQRINGADGGEDRYDFLEELLLGQSYRLALWKVATEEINYRRFFDINELAAIRVERPEVFNDSHRLVFELIREGAVTGLRVDHPDGLYDPSEYLKKLQEDAVVASLEGAGGHETLRELVRGELKTEYPCKPFYIVGEKILMKGEKIPEDWPIYGTTGYGFMNLLNGIFIKTEHARQMDEVYSRFTREPINFADLLYSKKKLILDSSMSGELNVLGHRLSLLAGQYRQTRDFTFLTLTKALSEVLASFPVYRTYITAAGVNERDRRYIEAAVKRAQRANPSISGQAFNFIRKVLFLEYPRPFSEEEKTRWLDFVMRFQQFSGPVMAKGMEDTAFYCYSRFLSLNEVGGAPEKFGYTLDAFHGQNIERTKGWNYAMLATSTHDSKRSEGVRARINVLTEMPRLWKENVFRWRRLNRKKKKILEGRSVPDLNEEYHLYQALLGIWPIEHPEDIEAEREELQGRFEQYMIKALRECKVNTSWINPDSEYEDAVREFIRHLLAKEGPFVQDFARFAAAVTRYGMFNSLSQVLLKAASPGVPDFYQGTELWFLYLVDPDNRRKVDFGLRMRYLEELKRMEAEMDRPSLCRALLENMQDGKIKLYATWKALNFRKERSEEFLTGDYTALESEGVFHNNVCAFLRAEGILAAAPRFFSELAGPEWLPLGEVWSGTRLLLPRRMRLKDVFSGNELESAGEDGRHFLYLKDVFRDFPLFLAAEVKK